KTAQWYSMQKLTNYSAFDRDKGKFISDIKVADIQNQDTVIQPTEPQIELSENAQKVLDWLESKEPGQWFYYRSSDKNKRDNAFTMMLSRLGLLNNESALEDIFLELLETENVDISDDGLGLKLL
ncbi:MAG: hypothetical protein AAF063_36240, partial [Cyanobacteria bacterium J06643_5]